jgi:exonuclease SbcC
MIPDLHTLSITNFRSIRGTVHIPLNAPIILLHGHNGAGKTSVLSALELALTGEVAALRRDDPNYVKHLVHDKAERASIRLSGPGLAPGTSALTVVENGSISRQPILDAAQGQFFSERCYLAQSVLGRLLDIYSRADSEKGSPLTRFVKDLLRLDELDALVEGLHDAGHLARMKNLVPALRRVDELRGEHRGRRDDARKTYEQFVREDAQRLQALPALIGAAGLAPPPSTVDYADLEALRDRLSVDREAELLVQMSLRSRELGLLRAGYADLPEDADAAARTAFENDLLVATDLATQWRETIGVQLERTIDSLRGAFPDLPSWAATDPEAAQREAQTRVITEIDRLEKAIEQDRTAELSAENLSAEMARAESRLQVIDDQLGGLGTFAGGLARALADVVPHIHGEDCPVCGQDFNGTHQGTLSVYVQKRIAMLTEEAGRLSALTTERAHAQQRLIEVTRQWVSVSARPDSAAALALKSRLATLVGPARELGEIAPAATEGANLIRRQARMEGRLAQLRDRDRRLSDLRNGISALASRLGQPDPPLPEAPDASFERLRQLIGAEEGRLSAARRAREEARGAIDVILETRLQAVGVAEARDEAGRAHDALENAFQATRRIGTQARSLGDTAREVRTSIVRRVFNEGLNALWRDLFVRLAPTEPYVPAFRLPETPDGVVAQLETRTRTGEIGGTPGAMLSAGNLNTAALTLFLALHLSVEAKEVPWLVLDDPVQSMDEVHIAQFAALLRTVSKDHGRKVIIAVHDRALFEYLSLELSPAFRNDQLITVDLRRSADEETFADPNILPYLGEDVVAA